MSDRDLALVENDVADSRGDLSSYEPGPLTETLEDRRDDIRQIIDDLQSEKAAGAPRKAVVRDRQARGDTSAF